MAVKAKAVAQFVLDGRTVLPGEEVIMDQATYERHLAVSDVEYIEDVDADELPTPVTDVPADDATPAPAPETPAEDPVVPPADDAAQG